MSEKLLKDLNAEQQKAVTHGEGPFLIVAGAGTGKTTVITERIGWLIETERAKSDEILALTFTERAAGEMEERVDRLLPYGYVDLWIMTFHSFGQRMLEQHGLEIGLPDSFKVLSATEQWRLVRQNLERFNLNYFRPLGNPAKFIHALLKHFSRCKDESITPAQYLDYVESQKLNKDNAESTPDEFARLEEVARAYQVYQQLLHESGVLDFGDLINCTLRLFTERPHLLKQYQDRFKYILVDEFQDTNFAQYQLVKLLAGTRQNLTVVGDDDQSIYKFRGASISNIMTFKKDFSESAQVVLTQNYRSGQSILDLAYNFIQLNNPDRLEARLSISKRLVAARPALGEIEHLHAGTAHEETRLVVEKIIGLKEKNSETDWSDFAILVRANNQAEQFIQALQLANIPFQFLAARGLYSKAIIMDILAYFRLLDNYHESPSMYRVLNFPLWQIATPDLIQLLHWANRKSWSLYETARQNVAVPDLTEETRTRLRKIMGLLEKHAALARQPEAVTSRVLYAMLEDTGYLKWLTQEETANQREQLGYLNRFLKKIQAFEESGAEKNVKQFLEAMQFELDSGDEGDLPHDPSEGPDTVKILTAHSAKGLEFRYVFVVNMVHLRFPTTERTDPIEIPLALIKDILPEGDVHLQEERRLFYVAMTRAKEGLYFSSAEDYGGLRKKKLSRFLVEKFPPLRVRGGEPPPGRSEGALRIRAAHNSSQPPLTLRGGAPAALTPQELLPLLPDRFSFTQLKAYETCPWQYYYAHVLRIPVMGRYTFSFGKTMHLTLQRFFERVMASREQASLFNDLKLKNYNLTPPPLDDLLKIYDDAWIDDWYNDKAHQEEYRDKGRRLLKEFYEQHKDNWPTTKFLEKPFTLKIGDVVMKGAIDRADTVPGGIEIIDYKTGNVPKDDKAVDHEQLLLYQLAAEQVMGEKPVLLSYYYLDGNKKFSFLGTPDELKEEQAKIQSVVAKVKSGDFTPTPGLHCKTCDFREICPFRAL